MYSQEEQELLALYERESFRKIKLKENEKREIKKSQDILYTSDFIMEDFPNSGDSGSLLLATSKHNCNEKYIIKHAYYDCACNEYMYSKIGNKMGIKIAPVKLFIVDDKEEIFKCDFVCGIKYFEDCNNVKYIDIIKNNIKNWQDYFKMLSLGSLLQESDGIEVIRYGDEIYRLDTTDAFTLSNIYIYQLAYDYNKNGINIKEIAEKNILNLANRNLNIRKIDWDYNKKVFIEKFGTEYLKYYLETFTLLNRITEEDIEEWTSNLTIIYPNIIGEYFKIYLNNLKLDTKDYLNGITSKS